LEEKLSFIQRLIRSLPGNWASDMEAESRKWIARCRECGSRKVTVGPWRHQVESGRVAEYSVAMRSVWPDYLAAAKLSRFEVNRCASLASGEV
jgi:hypothetical protein